MLTPANPLVPPSAGGDVEMMAPLAGPNLQRAARVRLVPCGVPATDAKGVFVEEVPLCHTVREVQAALAARLEADAAAEKGGGVLSWLRGGSRASEGGAASAPSPLIVVANGSGEGAEYVPAPADMKVEELLAALPAARESSAEGEALTLFYTTETKFGDGEELLCLACCAICMCVAACCCAASAAQNSSKPQPQPQPQPQTNNNNYYYQQQPQQPQGGYNNGYASNGYAPNGYGSPPPPPQGNYGGGNYAPNAYGTPPPNYGGGPVYGQPVNPPQNSPYGQPTYYSAPPASGPTPL